MTSGRTSGDWTSKGLADALGLHHAGTSRAVTGVAPLGAAGAGDLSFCDGPKWQGALAGTSAAAVIARPGVSLPSGVAGLRSDTPRLDHARATGLLFPTSWPRPGVHPAAVVHPTAEVTGATIGPFVVIEAGACVAPGAWIQAHAFVGARARIGVGARVMPHVVVLDDCVVGERSCLHPGAVIGADGFGYVPSAEGPFKVPHVGRVVLESDVDIGANTCVDRASMGETRVGRSSKLDNLVQVAHGVSLGAGALLAAFAGVAGSARIGAGAVMAGRSSVVEGSVVGDGVVLAGLAAVTHDLDAGAKVGGVPARGYRDWLREQATLRRLPRLARTVERLERRLEEALGDRT